MHLLTEEEEARRLQTLYQCDIIDTAPETAFDQLVALAASICETPIALISFIDDQREWFKAQIGWNISELPISQSLNIPLLTRPEPLIIRDIQADSRFSSYQGILGNTRVRFYASAPICSPDGFVLGAITIASPTPHDLCPQQQQALIALANQAGALLELRILRRCASENRQQTLLAELGRRAIDGVSISDLLEWATRHIARTLEVNRCRILELLPNNTALPQASFGWGTRCIPKKAMPLGHYLLAAYTLQAGQPIVIDSVAEEQSSGESECFHTHGITSGVSLIIPGNPRPYGLLSVYSVQQRRFTRTDIAFLHTVVDLLAEVIAQRQHQQNVDAVVNLSRILRPATTRQEMMTIILTHIHTVCHSEGSAIILPDTEGQAYVALGHGIWTHTIGTSVSNSAGPSWQVMQSGQPFLGDRPDFLPEHTIVHTGTVACVAMRFNERLIGALWAGYANTVSYHTQHLLITLADVAASALNRFNLHDQTTRLYQEHQQLTREVRRAERHLTSIVESAIDLVVSTDTEGRIITWNRAAERVSSFTREQMICRHLRDMCAPAHQAMMDQTIKSLIDGAAACQIEIPLISATHQDVPISWRLSTILSDTGESIGIVAVGRDLAEQRRLESQLFQAAKMASMGMMASGIGHELRNPLGIISANAQLAQERLPDHEIVRTCLQQIHAATKRAALIIDNLLTFARPRSEGSQVMASAIDVNEVLAATFMLLDYQIQRHHVKLNVTLSHTMPQVSGNAALLQQVFTNLILNALQAMAGGGTLTVTTQTSTSAGVEVIFSDTGSGISPEVLPQIFDPFFTTRPVGQGTGLGLAISYSIIQQHRGIIEASSSPGMGSSFHVRLPAASVS